MTPQRSTSEFRFEKRRADATLTLVGGEVVTGCFFIAAGSTRRAGGERVSDLLNSEPGFFPFEIQTDGIPSTVLYNRSHVIAVQIFDDEAQRDPGYAVAKERLVSIVLSNGQRTDGAIRIYRPEGHDRVSDWTRQPETFRYLQSRAATFIVNAAHIVAVIEVQRT